MRSTSKKRKSPKSYHRSVLKNGIVLVTEKATHFQTLAIGVWVKSGSREESENNAGMAHFLEHMMFKGTSRRSALEIARAVDLIGGEFNAMTDREYTCFHITLPVTELSFAIELLAEILKDSQFDEVEIDRERGVILQEFMGAEESPEEFIHDMLLEKAYPNHPLGRNIIGTQKSVSSFKRRHVMSFFQQHYFSKNIIVTVAGDVEHRKVASLLNRELKDFKGKARKPSKASLRTPKFTPNLHLLKRKLDQCHLLIGYDAYAVNDERRLAAFLLNAFLGGGMSSSLFQAIREQRGLAYTVYSSLISHRDCGIICLYVATSPKLIATCAQIIRDEVQKLIQMPLTSDDLLIVKNSLKSAVLLGGDSMETRMMALAKSELYYDSHLSNHEVCELIERVDAKAIQSVAKDLFNRKPIILVLGDMNMPQLKRIFG